MGMMRQGNALSDENKPSLGRGMGVGSTNQQRVANGPQSEQQATPGMQRMQHGESELPKDANSVPGFPQDAFMEGPMMAMDQMVEKPENYGLRAGWSGFMQGMMTLVRVLPPDLYEKITTMQKLQEKQKPKAMPPMEHPHGH
jgi:manganese oxidase